MLVAAKACLESAETQKQRGVGGAGISRVDGAISQRTKRLCAVVQTPPPPQGAAEGQAGEHLRQLEVVNTPPPTPLVRSGLA